MFPFPMWSPWGGLSPSCFPAPPPLPAVPARRGSDLPRATAPLAGHSRGGQLCLGVPLLLGAPLGGAGGRQRGDSCKRGGTGMQVAPCTNAVPPSHPPCGATHLGDAGSRHGGQQGPHRAVLHHKGLTAGAAGAPPPRAGGQRGQVALLQLCCQASGLTHHLLQPGPTQGAPAPVCAPWGLLLVVIILTAGGEGQH